MSAECLVSCLEALEDVDSAATAVAGEARNVLQADARAGLVAGGGALSDALGALAAGLKDIAAAELAREVDVLDISSVTLDRDTVRGSDGGSEGGSEENDRLVHGKLGEDRVCQSQKHP